MEKQPKKKSKKKLILIVLGVLLAIGAVSAILFPEEETEIVWDDEKKMGTVTFELDGDVSLIESIYVEYLQKIEDFVENVDKDSLKDYEYIYFEGNIKQNGQVLAVPLRGELTIDFIKNADSVSVGKIEMNLQNVRVPEELQDYVEDRLD